MEFVFGVIDPFINKHWGLCAIDFDEDYDSYTYFPPTLISHEIDFIVSKDAVEYAAEWEDDLNKSGQAYQKRIREQIQNLLETNKK